MLAIQIISALGNGRSFHIFRLLTCRAHREVRLVYRALLFRRITVPCQGIFSSRDYFLIIDFNKLRMGIDSASRCRHGSANGSANSSDCLVEQTLSLWSRISLFLLLELFFASDVGR